MWLLVVLAGVDGVLDRPEPMDEVELVGDGGLIGYGTE